MIFFFQIGIRKVFMGLVGFAFEFPNVGLEYGASPIPNRGRSSIYLLKRLAGITDIYNMIFQFANNLMVKVSRKRKYRHVYYDLSWSAGSTSVISLGLAAASFWRRARISEGLVVIS
jgi:hypothetical protein